MACFQYFSFNLPTASTVIFITFSLYLNSYSSYPQVIHLFTAYCLNKWLMYINSLLFLCILPTFLWLTCRYVDNSVNNVGISLWIVHKCW
ncbi:hypothetical protein BU039_07770 [Staphylococcus simulans]|nr:hypothetical protein BU039_07770 [Staphylococcus simulans]